MGKKAEILKQSNNEMIGNNGDKQLGCIVSTQNSTIPLFQSS